MEVPRPAPRDIACFSKQRVIYTKQYHAFVDSVHQYFHSSKMEQEVVVKHFTDVASRYDDLYGFAYDYIPQFAIKYLELKPDDVLADIGAGTGAISSLIWKKAGIP